jgi:hypothetical protein
MVKTQDHYVPADFMILDMGEEEEDVPIILGRPFLNYKCNHLHWIRANSLPIS